jgi:hypothetical protein
MSRGYLSQRAYRLKLVSWAALSAFCFILLTLFIMPRFTDFGSAQNCRDFANFLLHFYRK